MTRLPAESDAFIGRGQDLARLHDGLATERLVTLCAACGMGKSRLAFRFARENADDYPDGVALVKLADLDLPEQVVGHVADRLGIVEERGREPLDTLTDALRARRMLLVLDNCEHLIASVAELSVRLLADCPALRILATSREPLHVPGEIVRRVPALRIPSEGETTAMAQAYDAVRLFAVRATARRPEFRLTPVNVEDVVRICRALDGMPLAIELAAARVAALSPAEIADRLDDRFRLLTTGDRTAHVRQHSLQAAVDWSHDLLTRHERILFRRLSVFAEGWTLAAVETICADEDLPRTKVLDTAASLVEKSLVFCVQRPDEESRYGMLQTIREYASEKLDVSGETEAVRRAHRDWYLATCKDRLRVSLGAVAGSKPGPFAPIERDYANILAALNWSREQEDVEAGLRLSVAMTLYWMPRGRLAEAYSWLDRFLEIQGAPVAGWVRARALACRAQFGLELGDLSAAVRDAAPALELSRADRDDWGAGAALYVLGMERFRAGDLDAARPRFTEAVEAAAAAKDVWQEALAYGALAAIATRQQDWEAADRHYKDALALAERQRVPLVRGQVLTGMGILAQHRGDLSLAKERLETSLTLLRDHGYLDEAVRCLVALTRLAIAENDVTAARRYISEVLPVSRESGRRLALARGLEAAATVARLEQDDARTVRLAGAAAELRRAVDGSPAAARFRRLIRGARDRLGDQVADHLWEEGRTMGPDAAIELALPPAAPAAPPSRADHSAASEPFEIPGPTPRGAAEPTALARSDASAPTSPSSTRSTPGGPQAPAG